jgi:DNA replication and repair protein RecF
MTELSSQKFYQATPIGAQKDDVKFLLNKKLAKTAASRGENRTIIFAILARQIEILRATNPEVFVILDDIDSELDDVHKNNLYKISALSDNNLFATTIKFKGRAANHIRLS